MFSLLNPGPSPSVSHLTDANLHSVTQSDNFAVPMQGESIQEKKENWGFRADKGFGSFKFLIKAPDSLTGGSPG